MPIGPSAIVILGASGDLAQRKLVPALSALYAKGEIDHRTAVIGTGRTEYSNDEFRRRFDVSEEFAQLLSYHVGLDGLKRYVDNLGDFHRVIVFMALPPSVYAKTAAALSDEGFSRETTLIVEKPFGYDYESARKLNGKLAEYFDESQIFRIDHYLAKEAVQNILVFRFANSLFYPVWNSGYIESIQINASESIGIENRGGYFDGAGMLRDMVQNHLMQMLCLMTMEAPVSLNAEDIRAQKLNVLKAVTIESCKRMQYRGYLDEKGVKPGSTTETYAEMKLSINNFRWVNTPVYIRAGKALDRKSTEIGIRFKKLPRLLFNKDNAIPSNTIVFQIQPSAGIVVDMASRIPGSNGAITRTNMRFCYGESFQEEIPEAYQKLLLDALLGDRTLFVGADETEISWRKVEPFLDAGELGYYDPGTVPQSQFDVEWIDFDRFCPVCPEN